MAAPDDTGLKNLITSNLPDSPPGQPRRITAAFMRATLFALIDWVKTGINNNISTWLRLSDNQPGGANTDVIYRTGRVVFKGGHDSVMTTQASTMASSPLYQAGMQIQGAKLNGPAFLEFHVPGLAIQQFGVDNDGGLKYRPYNGPVYSMVLNDGGTAGLLLAAGANTKKIVLHDVNGEQFFGFGVNNYTLRYQVSDTQQNHVFYAGTSPATSNELLRIKGNGQVGIGTSNPSINSSLEIARPGFVSITANSGGLDPSNSYGLAMGWNKSAGQAEANLIWVNKDFPNAGLAIGNYDGVSYKERLRIDPQGGVGIGTPTPTAKLDIVGDNGYAQLRLQKSFTPTATNDARGSLGNFAWDQNYLYIRTPDGWRRAPLQSF